MLNEASLTNSEKETLENASVHTSRIIIYIKIFIFIFEVLRPDSVWIVPYGHAVCITTLVGAHVPSHEHLTISCHPVVLDQTTLLCITLVLAFIKRTDQVCWIIVDYIATL